MIPDVVVHDELRECLQTVPHAEEIVSRDGGIQTITGHRLHA